jgi:hypothetical protein
MKNLKKDFYQYDSNTLALKNFDLSIIEKFKVLI